MITEQLDISQRGNMEKLTQQIKTVIGDLVISNIQLQVKIEELETKVKELEEINGKTNSK